MKLACRPIALAAILAASSASAFATSSFFESFETGIPTAPGATASGQTLNLASGDWYAVNHSGAIGSVTGVFSDGVAFSAYHGTKYAGFNYNSTSGANTISVWLITPELSFTAGDTVSFYTRTADGSTYADRLVVRASDNGSSLNIGAGADDVGDFDMVLGTVNAGLSSSGYPSAYTEFTYTVPFTGAGRVAFNYHVASGGPSGANSNFIGIDAVNISASLATVPEPSAFAAMAGAAGLGLALMRRRRAAS